jgi:hypothetical protein
LLSSSRCCSPLRLLLYLGTRFFMLLLFSSCSSVVLFALLLLMCCYTLKNLVLPPCIPSCMNWEWLRVKNWKLVFF